MAEVQPRGKLEESLKNIYTPDNMSHKGQNGRLLIIGGSQIFHAASLWSAETASHFVDLVHYSSTVENNQIFVNLKSKFTNGIVIPQEKLFDYVAEDDCIAIGMGMERGDNVEAKYTHNLIKSLIEKFPNKRFVFDAAALQMMKPEWMNNLSQKAIVTPHAGEFKILFEQSLDDKTIDEKKSLAAKMAQQYNCIVLLKTITDVVTDGESVITIEGGNVGLTKGGSGDVLAGLAGSFYTKNDPLASAIVASYLVKSTAEALFETKGLFFNTADLISCLPETAKKLLIIE